MKHIKTYLNLAVAITFCASINSFAMEFDSTGEWFEELPIGTSDTSNESGIEDLEKQINELQTINNIIHNTLKLEIPYAEKEQLKPLLKLAQETIAKARDMLLGLILINTEFIDQQIKSIKAQWNNIPFQIILKKQIKELHTINNIINGTLKFRLSTSEHEKLEDLLKLSQKTVANARDMLLGLIPIDTEFIDQQIKSIKAQWNNIPLKK